MCTRHIGQRAVCLLAAATAMAATAAIGQELGEPAKRQIQAIYADKAAWTAAQAKLGTSLLYASRQSRGETMVKGMAAGQDLALVQRVASRAGVEPDGMVVVDIRAEVTDALLAAIGSAGGKVVSAFPAFHAVRARIPVGQVEAIAALDEVRQIAPQEVFLLNTGTLTSQGDTAHRVAAARGASSLNGTGIKVGVLSNGVDTRASRQASLDLPADCASPPGPGSCLTVVPGQAGTGDEGTAMLEIVHDLAPGAKLYFATAIGGEANFANNILTLRNTYGCDIIVDDVTYLAEGAFQDGPISQAISTVKSAGALVFTSAGNSGRKDASSSGTWEGDWLDSGQTVVVGNPPVYGPLPMHSFNAVSGAGAVYSNILTVGSGPYVILKWADPLGASTNDYDLLHVNADFTQLIEWSIDRQDVTKDPIEGVYPVPAGDGMVIVRYSGAARALRLDTNRGELSFGTARAVVGHNGAEGAITVAATDGRVPTSGNPFVGGTTNSVEWYSSDGPRRMFYFPNGTAMTPGNFLFATAGGRELQKPDMTAADCILTTAPGFSPFCGTSAAAPHAAAIAALLLSSANKPSGGQALAAMFATALDVTPGAGRDRNAGVGIVMADTALQALTTIPNAQFYTVDPCRVVDTRTSGGAIACGTDRTVTVVGACGVPSGAKAVSLNVTVTAPTAAGNVRVYAAGAPTPSVSSLNYSAGQTRGNNAIAPLSTDGKMAVACAPSGTAHVIVDVNGYFK
jgi:hypothetical protein